MRVCAQRPVCVDGRGRLGGSFGRVGPRVRARARIYIKHRSAPTSGGRLDRKPRTLPCRVTKVGGLRLAVWGLCNPTLCFLAILAVYPQRDS